jgi:hypothetical protein
MAVNVLLKRPRGSWFKNPTPGKSTFEALSGLIKKPHADLLAGVTPIITCDCSHKVPHYDLNLDPFETIRLFQNVQSIMDKR